MQIEKPPASPPSLKKRLITLLKVIFTAAAITFIIMKADLDMIWHNLKTISPIHIFIAFIFLNIGQIISALRMRYYFLSENLYLSKKFSVLFYFAGNFFNLILPGGIGGDGYKAYMLKKLRGFPVIKSVKLILSGRASGLLLLVLIALILALFVDRVNEIPYSTPLIMLAFLANIIGYNILAKFLLKEKTRTQIKAGYYSFLVQVMVLITAYFLFLGSDVSAHEMPAYLMLFMISSIISVLPISLGGVGLRELTFFKGAPILGLNPELGIAVSIVYFFINSLSSFIGLLFINRLKEIIEKE